LAISTALMRKVRLTQIEVLAKAPEMSSRESSSKPEQTESRAKLLITNA